jgi:small ligand-binding sensory domain FIST
MQWASGLGSADRFETAFEDAADALAEGLDSSTPDLVTVFVGSAYREHFVRAHRAVLERFAGAKVIGCSAAGVVGGGREIEDAPAIALTAAVLPDVELQPFHLEPDEVPPRDSSDEVWRHCIGLPRDAEPTLVLLPDPHSCRVSDLLAGLDAAFPGAVKIGGLASGASSPGQTALYAGSEAHGTGVVGLALWGNVECDTIVAQGCRPVGVPMFVTRGEGNVIAELDGRRPAEILQELYDQLPEEDQQLMRFSLFLGLVMSEGQEVYRQGDFLVRNIVGLDGQTGAIAVGAEIQPNRVVQFHLRDAATSAADLEALLGRYVADDRHRPAGGLMFSCVGRGDGLYGQPNHDTAMFHRIVGPVPLGGFFSSGEIGPVHGRTHLHGYTSSFGLFRPRHAN